MASHNQHRTLRTTKGCGGCALVTCIFLALSFLWIVTRPVPPHSIVTNLTRKSSSRMTLQVPSSPKRQRQQDEQVAASPARNIDDQDYPYRAKGLSTFDGRETVPGAVVCRDYQTVMTIIRLYQDYWVEKQAEARMGAEASAVGPPAVKPDPQMFGCTLLPPGYHVTVGTPVKYTPYGVRVSFVQDGHVVAGVSYSRMFVYGLFEGAKGHEEQRPY